MDFSRFKVITFDCYGTLIDWETGIFGALRPVLGAHGKQLSDSELLQLYAELEANAESGTFMNYRDVLKQVVRRSGERLGFRPTEQEICSLPDSLATWPAFPDTAAALRRLKSKYRLAIMSNIDDDLFANTRPKLGVELDAVITAQQAQAYKPSLKLFELAQKRIGADHREWLHVGQSKYHDVAPAQSLKISTVWVNRPSPRSGGAAKTADVRPDVEVASMAELAQMAVPAAELRSSA
jgi:2-haloacid dehalogenase